MEREAVLGNAFSAFMHFTTYVPGKCPIGCIISEAECPGPSEIRVHLQPSKEIFLLEIFEVGHVSEALSIFR